MLTIRRAQMKEFGKLGMRNFEARAIAHLERFFPEQCESLGSAVVLDGVRYGIKRATAYRLESERDLLRYLTLMFSFGRNFDVDPALPWAAAILTSAEKAPSRTKRLQTKARNHRNQGKGFLTQESLRKTGQND